MRVEILGIKGTWRDVANSANTTIGKDHNNNEISSKWKRKMLLCEHSPIRQITVKWRWIDIPYWVSVHLVRHKIGIEHWVMSQRTDRTNIDRNTLSQNALVIHECEANIQAIINISRKRLCRKASLETRMVWYMLINILRLEMPELFSVCVPECIYRGDCYEYNTCGWNHDEDYKARMNEYKGGV